MGIEGDAGVSERQVWVDCLRVCPQASVDVGSLERAVRLEGAHLSWADTYLAFVPKIFKLGFYL